MGQPGMVYLVGAGPGDYKLISVKGMECLKKADCVIYDRLADSRLLQYVRPDAELVYAGKAAGSHTLRQEEINRLLAVKAAEGRTVVRLKGGDPFVFGRGGEEILHLVEHNIAFEIIPGITSATAVPAYAGIPVTHRGLAASFAVVAGHEDPEKASSIRWDKLAQGVDTLVFVMGVENLAQITARLTEHGRSPDTPAAIICRGTKPEQRTYTTTLGQAAQAAADYGIKPPAIFIVGEVVQLRRQLAWYDRKPLFGRTILVTRAREQAGALAEGLEAQGAQCIEAPAIQIAPPASFDRLDGAIASLSAYQWLIFTSVNGVKYFFNRLHKQGKDARALAGVRVAAIGAQTAAKLQEYGIRADIIPVEFRAEGVAEALGALIAPGVRVLIPRAAVARDVLPERLTEMGAVVDVVEAYRTIHGEAEGTELKARLAAGQIDIVTFTSSSTVTNLLDILGEDGAGLIKRARVACIGPITASACMAHNIIPAVIADEYTIEGLIDSILKMVKEEENQ